MGYILFFLLGALIFFCFPWWLQIIIIIVDILKGPGIDTVLLIILFPASKIYKAIHGSD